MSAQHRLDVGSRRGPMHLCRPPLLGVVAEDDPPGPGIDVLPSDQRCGRFVDPPLRVDGPLGGAIGGDRLVNRWWHFVGSHSILLV